MRTHLVIVIASLVLAVLACGPDTQPRIESRVSGVDPEVKAAGDRILDWLGKIDKIEVRGDQIFIMGQDGRIFQSHPSGHGQHIPGHFHLQMTTGSGTPVDLYFGPDGKPVHQIPYADSIPSGTETLDDFFPDNKVPKKLGTVILGQAVGTATKSFDVYSWATDPVGTATETVIEKLVFTPVGATLTAEAAIAIAVSSGAIIVAVGMVGIAEQMQQTIDEWDRILAEQPLTEIPLNPTTLRRSCEVLIGEYVFGVEYDNLSLGVSQSILNEALDEGLIQMQQGEEAPLADCFDIVFGPEEPGDWAPEPPDPEPSPSESPTASPEPEPSPSASPAP